MYCKIYLLEDGFGYKKVLHIEKENVFIRKIVWDGEKIFNPYVSTFCRCVMM